MENEDNEIDGIDGNNLVILKMERQRTSIYSFFNVINQIATLSIQETDLQAFLKRVFHIICNFFQFDSGGIYLVNWEKGQADLQYSFGISDSTLKKVSNIDIHISPYNQIFKENKPLYSENYSEKFPLK